MEVLRLRVKDLDCECRAVMVRNGKGGKGRVVTLPDELIAPLKTQLSSADLLLKRSGRLPGSNMSALCINPKIS